MKSSNEIASHQPTNTHELITNISRLMDEAEEMLSESSSQHAEETVALLRERDSDPACPILARSTATKSKIAEAGRRTDKAIRAYPYESAALALGAGLLLGACFSRRSN